jgi:hypothetical protein
VPETEAKKFRAIVPPTPADNIVPMAKGVVSRLASQLVPPEIGDEDFPAYVDDVAAAVGRLMEELQRLEFRAPRWLASISLFIKTPHRGV